MRRRIRVQVGQRYFQDFAHDSHNQIGGVALIHSEGEWAPHARPVIVKTHQRPRRCHAARWTGQHSFRRLNA